MSDPALDEIDKAIVAALEQDGRRPFREIARALDISEGTIRARFRRLTENGTLKIVAFADPARTGQSRLALLFLTVAPEHHEAVITRISAYPEVSYVSTVLGRADVFAQVLVADDQELWRFIQQSIRPLDGVLDTESIIEISVHKLWFDGARTL